MNAPRPGPVLPPELAQLVRRPVTRRSFLRGASVSGLVLAGGGLLDACGTPAAKQTSTSCVSQDLSSTQHTLNFSNWPAYMDQKRVDRNGSKVTILPTLEDFQKQTGITVNYNTDVNDNIDFFEKVRNQLGACEPVDRDIFVLTDWMAARMINLGWLQKLDHAKMPNVDANLAPKLKSPAWDPNRDYSVPWQSGLTGIAYNEQLTGKVSSFEELVTRPDLKGKVTLLTEMRDTMLFMLLVTGADPEKFTADQWGTALDKLKQVVAAGQIRAFNGNNYLQDLVSGNVSACEAWSGDVIITQYDNPHIKFVAPQEGLALWSDNMLVPNKATHETNAEKLMNYYYDPEVAARLAAWVNYICPVSGAREAMQKIDPSLVGNPLIFPDDTMLSKTHGFMALDETTSRQYESDFAQVTGV
ncbi:MAG: polyamine ABC transporter substrate-binding protein [Nocardioidaceae bacterium]